MMNDPQNLLQGSAANTARGDIAGGSDATHDTRSMK